MDRKVHPLRRGTGLLVLLLAAGLVLTAACSSGSEATAADEPVVATEEHDDAEAHEDAEAREEGDEDANAYLEVAPKEQLFLVQMTNFAFTPDVLEAQAGEVIEIAIQNVEAVLHDFTIDKIDADLHISYLGGTGEHAHDEGMDMEAEEADLHFALTEPGSGVVHIKVHEPGEYVIYCSVPGHREAGMVGTLIIR